MSYFDSEKNDDNNDNSDNESEIKGSDSEEENEENEETDISDNESIKSVDFSGSENPDESDNDNDNDSLGKGPDDSEEEEDEDVAKVLEIDSDAEPQTSTKKLKKIKKNVTHHHDDDDDDDDDPSGDIYLKKFDKEINHNYLTDNHPECVSLNYDEILAMTKIVRDKTGVIIDDLHKTIPYLTKYERARILGQRAVQINSGATTFVKVPEKIIDGYFIAELELQEKRIPFIIRRPLPNGGSEYWCVKDLENIAF